MLKEITNVELNESIKEEEFEYAGFIVKEKIQFFEADSINDVIQNYHFLSQGQYNPLIFDLKKMFSNDEDGNMYDIALKTLTEVRQKYMDANAIGGNSVYDDYFRNTPPKGVETLPIKLVEIKNLSYPNEIYTKNYNLYSVDILSTRELFKLSMQESVELDTTIVSVSDDLRGHKGLEEEFNVDEYFSNRLFRCSIEDIDKIENHQKLKYTGLFQVLPLDYVGCKAFFTFSNYSLRMYSLHLEDSDDDDDDTKNITPVVPKGLEVLLR